MCMYIMYVCFYNLNQDRYCVNELVTCRNNGFSSVAAEKDKVTTFCFPELETQATCSM